MEYDNDIYNKAIEKFGKNNQIIMAIQEMTELTKELTDYLTLRYDKINDIPGEIADVKIMLEQLEIIFGVKGVVETRKLEKLERLEGLINE